MSDFSKSLAFYVDLLGFRVDYQRPEEGFASLSLEDTRLMLESLDSYQASSEEEFKQGKWRTGLLQYPLGRGVNLEITIENIEPACLKLKEAEYPLTLDLYEKQYRVHQTLVRVRQFLVMDPDGYLIRFAQNMGEKSL